MHPTNLGPTEPYQDLQDSGRTCEITLSDPSLACPSFSGNQGFGSLTPLWLPRMVSLPPYSAEPRALPQWVPMPRKILSPLGSPAQWCPLLLRLRFRNIYKKLAHWLLPKCIALLCHHHWRGSRFTKHRDGTELGRTAGMEKGRFSIQHVLSKLGIEDRKTTIHFGEGKCKILHVGCYAHMEPVTPA